MAKAVTKWNSGAAESHTSRACSAIARPASAAWRATKPAGRATSLGSPVVPDVKYTWKGPSEYNTNK